MASIAAVQIEIDAALVEEINRLRGVLQSIADHHDDQRARWEEVGDYDTRRYHEDRRNLALMHLTHNAK